MAGVSVLIVEGRPAGLSAAVQARELDATVTLLEAEQSAAPASTAAPLLSVPSPVPLAWSGTGPPMELFGLRGMSGPLNLGAGHGPYVVAV
jgi:thioredoxin reductase